jgi:FtsP/CotA-like multicopper oxidase with cupredoxin domain
MPAGARGDVSTLWTLAYSHLRSGYAKVPSVPVAHLRNAGRGPTFQRFAIDEGDPLLVHPRVDTPIENLKGLPILEHLLDPSQFSEPLPGSPDEEIRLTNTDKRPSIDGVNGDFRGTRDDFRLVPHIATSRFARIGDLLELAVSNETGMHHPFHLHGFSFQPVRVEDLSGNNVLTYDYNEFVDTVDIPGRHRLVFRVRLDDRFMMDGATPGGAVGRWLFHCHIAFHAALGMISELVVLP